MEIEYQLTEEDIIALTLYRLQKVPKRQNPILVRRIAYAISFAFVAIGSWALFSNAILSFNFLVTGVLAYFIYPFFFNWALRRRVKTAYRNEKMRETLAPRILSASSEGIEERTSLGQIRIKWEAVDNIGIMPTFTVLSIQGVPSIIIPENRIISGDYISFVEACRQFSQKGTA